MGSLHKNMQLMLEFLKASFLVLYFSYYTLSVVLPSMLIILLSILSVMRHLVWQQLELGCELESDLQDTGLGQELVC